MNSCTNDVPNIVEEMASPTVSLIKSITNKNVFAFSLPKPAALVIDCLAFSMTISFEIYTNIEFQSLMISVAITSQFVSNISPLGSMSFTPLSGSGLWEAVIITPTTEPPKTRDLKVANTPIRNITLSKKSALKVCNNIIKSFNVILIKNKHNLNLCLDL
uniref:Uncharacterized protein n=1 Tax=Glossina austeni TaxID=7395 RepID=A0A1A9UTR8_GLOAU